jgi:subtilisin family serine protease
VQSSTRVAPHEKPEIMAPGIDISSTWTNGIYARASGTSQATPFVTSAIALALETETPFTTRAHVEELKKALMESAKPIPSYGRPHDDAAGYGILQAVDFIEAM